MAGAKATVTQINEDLWKSSAYAAIAEAEAKAGDIAAAKTTAAQIDDADGYEKTLTYCAVAKAQAKAGDIKAHVKLSTLPRPLWQEARKRIEGMSSTASFSRHV